MLGDQFLRTVVNWAVAMALGLEFGYPMMQLLPHPDTRLGYNNPDNLYFVARISDAATYRISGQRGTSVGLLVLALRELPGNGPGSGVTTAFLTGDDLTIDRDGAYAITLSAELPTDGAWLPLAPGTDNLLVRFTFQDWSRRAPRLHVDRAARSSRRATVRDDDRTRRRHPRRRGTLDCAAGTLLLRLTGPP